MSSSDDDAVIAFQQGISASLDPYNKDKLRGGSAKTTLLSTWLYKRCSKCKHTFRLDDVVYISTEGEVYHNNEQLDCAGKQSLIELEGQNEIFDFYNGIIKSYLPQRPVIPQIVTFGNESVAHLLSAPDKGFKRYQCGICAHTIRENDIIILCPCSPDEPLCRMAIHLDPFRGLNCWGAWDSNIQEPYCPTFSKRIRV